MKYEEKNKNEYEKVFSGMVHSNEEELKFQCADSYGFTMIKLFLQRAENHDEIVGWVREWATKNGINLFEISYGLSEFEEEFVFPIHKPSKTTISKLDQTNSVILMKNVDRITDMAKRRRILDLANEPVVEDENGEKRLLKDFRGLIAIGEPNESFNEFEFSEMDGKTMGLLYNYNLMLNGKM